MDKQGASTAGPLPGSVNRADMGRSGAAPLPNPSLLVLITKNPKFIFHPKEKSRPVCVLRRKAAANLPALTAVSRRRGRRTPKARA